MKTQIVKRRMRTGGAGRDFCETAQSASFQPGQVILGPRLVEAGRHFPARRILYGGASLAVIAFLLTSAPARSQQLPTGGSVAAGSATIGTPQGGTLNINQSTNQAIINWQGFSIGAGGIVNFNQPGASSATLNRVLGSTPSSIAGTINAPGTVLLVNPNGVAITKSGVINTGSFAASTLDMKDSDFLAGKYKFTGNGGSAAVSNAGRINVSDGGFVALLGGQVSNSGVISARLGKVGLGAGELATLDLAGDGFLSVTVPSTQLGNMVDAAGALVSNSGKIRADGGQVFLSAATAANILRNAVNVPGSIRANSVGSYNGRIVINGGTGGKVSVTGRLTANGGKSRNGGKIEVAGATVDLKGKLTANGKEGGVVNVGAISELAVSGTVSARGENGQGGRIDFTGANITVTAASIDASGKNGGGLVRIGGTFQGGNGDPTSALYASAIGRFGDLPDIASAQNVSIDAGSKIDVSARTTGDGGTAIVWADNSMRLAGTILAQGGAQSGDGGFVETSGKESLGVLDSAYVNTLAAFGAVGTWLLDPKNLIIAAGGSSTPITSDPYSNNPTGTDTIDPGAITGAASNVTLQASNDITVNSAVTMANSVLLTFNAGRSILINANVSSKGGFTATINDAGATAANRDAGKAAFTMANGTAISTVPNTTNANGGAVSITTGTLTADSTGATSLAANIGDITLAAINTGGVAGGASSNGAGGNITVINSQGNILSAPGGTVTISANGTTAASGTAAGKAGGTIQLTATNGSIGSALTRLGNISANGGNGTGTNQAGGNGGAVTLISGGDIWTGAISSALGARTGTGTVGTIGTQSLQAINGSITVTADSLSASALTMTANAATGTLRILPATASTTIGINNSASTLNLTTAVLANITANTLAVGNSSSTGQLTVGTGGMTIPAGVTNLVLTSSSNDTGFGGVYVRGSISGSTKNVTLNATNTDGLVYLEGGTINTATLTANGSTVTSSGNNTYNNASGTATFNATGVSTFDGVSSLSLQGLITASILKLSAPSNGEISQAVKAYTVGNLVVRGGSFIDLSGGNNTNLITNIAADTTGRIKLLNNRDLSIASVDGVDGVTADKFNLSFASNNRTVSQTAAANITANELSVVSGGTGTFVVNATLANAGNRVGTFAASVNAGLISLYGTNGLNIGQLRDIQGNTIATGVTAGSLTLSNSGSVTQSSRLNIANNLLLLGSGNYTLGTTTNTVTTLAANTTGRINLYNNKALVIGAFNGTNGVTANALNLQLGTGFATTQTQAINVNSLTLRNSSANNAVTYTLTNASNNVGSFAASVGTSGNISLTDINGLSIGSVLFDGTNFLNGVTANTLTLSNTGSVTQDAAIANRISATNLALLGTGGNYTLTNTANSVGTLAGNTGAINFLNNASLTIGAVGVTNGITASGAVTVAAAGASSDITVTRAVDTTYSGSGNGITLTAGRDVITSGASGTITANSATGTAINITAARNITLAGGSATMGISAIAGLVTLTAGNDANPNATIRETGGTGIYADRLLLTTAASSLANGPDVTLGSSNTFPVVGNPGTGTTIGTVAARVRSLMLGVVNGPAGSVTVGTLNGVSGITTANNLTLGTFNGNGYITAAPIVSGGNFTTFADFSLGSSVTVTGTWFLDSNTVNASNSAADVSLGGLFMGASSSWNQLAASLPSLSINDFRIGGTFLRATGGAGTTVSPYTLVDIYGLQGMATQPTKSYALASNIDASGTVNWNSGAGFVPVGDGSTAFSGNFDGQGHTIGGLVINRPSSNFVGLFGHTNGANIANVGLVGGSITGSVSVGSLIGYQNLGSVTHAFSTASVSGFGDVGGLVGTAAGSISGSYATGNVSGSFENIGGLVGSQYDSITQSYATGSVTGGSYVGGLVGYNSFAAISQSYAVGAVSGTSNVGGLVGASDYPAYITSSYWDQQTTGQMTSAGGIGRTTADMQDLSAFQTNYSGWDFQNVWAPPNQAGQGGQAVAHYPELYAMTPVAWVRASDVTRTYGDANPAFTGTSYGGPSAYIFGPSGDTLDLSGPLSTTANQNSDVGVYSITGSPTATSANGVVYRTVTSGNLTITAATLLATANAAARDYGDANPSLSGLITGFKNSQTAATFGGDVWTTGADVNSNVGSYAINGGLTNASPNYVFSQAAGNNTALTVNAATLTFTANAAARDYGDANPSLSGLITGFKNSQTAATFGGDLWTTGADVNSNVGSYAINGGLTNASPNYVFSQAAGNNTALTVNAATLTFTANAAARDYGDANPSLSGLITGFKNSQTAANFGGDVWTTGADVNSNVGSYAINGGLTNASPNYVFSQAAGNNTALTVNAATLTFTANAAARDYGDANPSLSGLITGFKNSQTAATFGGDVWTTPADPSSSVGSYAIDGGLFNAAPNYAFVQAPGNATALTVNPKAPPPPSQPTDTSSTSRVSPSSPDAPSGPGVTITFQPPAGGPISVSFTPPQSVAANPPGADIAPAGLPDGQALAMNNGRSYPPISQFDANQYSQFALPAFADQAGMAAIFAMIARGADQERAATYLVDSFWNGTAGAWIPAGNGLTGKVVFSDGAGNTVEPTGNAGFAIEAGKTDFAQLLKAGPVMINGGGQPAHWLLATQMTADGKGIVANDPATGKQVLLGYDPASKTAGGVTGVFDPATKGFVALATATAGSPGDAALSSLQGFVPATFIAVAVK